jgi:hypothetical protein
MPVPHKAAQALSQQGRDEDIKHTNVASMLEKWLAIQLRTSCCTYHACTQLKQQLVSGSYSALGALGSAM